jgi:16S rRNA (cytosine967-C5)-methyltransferase
MSSPPKQPVSSGRVVAHAVLLRVLRDGAYAERALDAALARGSLEQRDAAFATALVYGVLRHVSYLDFLIRCYAKRKARKLPHVVTVSLRLGVYQLLFMRTPPHAVVHESVSLIRKEQPFLSGFVNAVLRACARDVESGAVADVFAHVKDPDEALGTYTSHPVWFVRKLRGLLGDAGVRAFCEANNVAPQVVYRVCGGAVATEALRARWEAEGYVGVALDAPFEGYLALEASGRASEVPGFAEGEVVVQDPAAGLAVRMMGVQAGWRVWDMCAAPGGKTLQLAECVGDTGKVLATELHMSKTDLITQNSARCGMQRRIRVEALDASDVSAVNTLLKACGMSLLDAVLLDAPCSGMGTLRRNPELRTAGEERVLELCALQDMLLDSAAAHVRVGGVLVYSVCTVTEEEGPQRVEAFLKRHPDFVRDVSGMEALARVIDAEGAVRTWPHVHGTDGFYAVKLLRMQQA